MEFKDVWLEIKACNGADAPGVVIGEGEVRSIPALLEVLSTARNTNASLKDSGMWDYSRRICKDEADQISKVVNLANRVEDERSVSLSANIIYEGSCYTLALFEMK
ncbi:MAG: hypothetical protein MN733_18540 [Nitrososphaera sp.]|nr:hypothetical protein [Nitrososphaera sp.]